MNALCDKRQVCWLAIGMIGLGLGAGCGDATNLADDPPILAAPALKSVTDPLTDAEMAVFLRIVADLPHGKVPDFQPYAGAPVNPQFPPDRLVELFRHEFRDRIDATREGNRWRSDPQLAGTLKTHGIEPEEFAALVTRISFAVAATEAMPGVDDVASLVSRLNSQLETLTSDPALQRAPEPGTTNAQRTMVVDAIRTTVSILSFLELMESVPAQSRAVVRSNREQLQKILPDIDRSRRALQAWSDRLGDIQPASYEQ